MQKQNRTSFAVLALTGLLLGTQVSAQCDEDFWPIYAGGNTGDEDVRCFVYDPIEQLVLVGGVTTSDDFAPASNEHAFLYALDLEANWKWGNFFYNLSYAVNSIDGCQMSSDGSSLALQAQSNGLPVIMDVDTTNGAISSFITLDKSSAGEEPSSYETFGAVYADKEDYRDSLEYFYTSFVENGKMFLLRVLNDNFTSLDWNYRFLNYSDLELEADALSNDKQPNFIVADPYNFATLILLGQYSGHGSVMKFNKRDGQIRYNLQFEKFTTISSYAQADTDDLFLCGHYEPTEGEYHATMSRIATDGSVRWIQSASGSHPLSAAEDSTEYFAPQDKCQGISYDKKNEKIAIAIQGKMSEVRSSSSGDFYDTILLKMSIDGQMEDIAVISQGRASYDMFNAKNGLFWANGDIMFSGFSTGFMTQRQEMAKDATNPDTDSYVYKYRFGSSNDCLFVETPNLSAIGRRLEFSSGQTAEEEGLVTFSSDFRSVRRQFEEYYFTADKSRYAGGFSLLSTMKVPRPCAYQSYDLIPVEYYRGQNSMNYEIYRQNSSTVPTFMTGSPYLIFQDGTDAESLAVYDPAEQSFYIQTDDGEMVGVQRTILRSCDNLDRLQEMYLEIEVLANTYPDFVSEPQTSFQVEIGEELLYMLPTLVDPEGNDEPEVFITSMENQEDQYPEFLTFDDAKNTLKFMADSEYYAGRTYYFTIMVKETNSDSVAYPFYCTVKVAGERVDKIPDEKTDTEEVVIVDPVKPGNSWLSKLIDELTDDASALTMYSTAAFAASFAGVMLQ